MRMWLCVIVLACAASACALDPRPRADDARPAVDAFRVATHNIHRIALDEMGRWSPEGWLRRREAVAQAFTALDADIVALQEAHAQRSDPLRRSRGPAVAWLTARRPDYAVAGVGRDGAPPHAQPILYRRGRFERVAEGRFGFGFETRALGRPGLDASAPSHAAWVKLRDRLTRRVLTFVNVHFDHRSSEAQGHAARLVARFAKARMALGEAVIVAGDLNVRRASRPVAILREAGLAVPFVKGATYHFGIGLNVLGAIDHVAHGPRLTALGPPRVLRKRFDGRWPSDHHPVTLDLAWR